MTVQVYLNLALVLAVFGLAGLVVWLLIEVKAMQRSTHQITYLDPLSSMNKHKNDDGSESDGFTIPPITEEENKVLRKNPFEDNLS